MSKFGLMDDEEEDSSSSSPTSISDKIAAFSPVRPRSRIDIVAADAAAAPHGFISRESSGKAEVPLAGRRRAIPREPTRHLAIRLTSSAYNRFVAYADRYQLTYHDALIRLLDTAGE